MLDNYTYFGENIKNRYNIQFNCQMQQSDIRAGYKIPFYQSSTYHNAINVFGGRIYEPDMILFY